MKVTIVGSRGLPARYGGFETFAEHISQACSREGISVEVINERDNLKSPVPEGIHVSTSDYNKGDSPMNFYKQSLKKAAADSDIIICCGVGGAMYFSRFRNSKAKIITNVDGLEHKRKKYTWWQRLIVHRLQKLAARHSDIIIADSAEIMKYWNSRFRDYSHKVKSIAYGADKCMPMDHSVLEECDLVQNEYFLVVSRLVPENNILEIIDAFNHYLGSKKLVIVGSLEDNSYVSKIERRSNERVLFTDAIYEKRFLDSLRQGCFLYLHGHSVGGTNPSLLEAMAAGCACMCHDNRFNVETTGGGQMYFRSSSELAIMLNILEHKASDLEPLKVKAKERVLSEYSWDKICTSYIKLFNSFNSRANEVAESLEAYESKR